MGYQPHQEFIAPARAEPALWRFGLGLIGAAAIYVALTYTYFRAMYVVIGAERIELHGNVVEGSSPLAMYLILFSFCLMALGPFVMVRLLHNRPALSLFGSLRPFFAQFRVVLLALIALGVAVTVLPPWGVGQPLLQNMPMGAWSLLLPLSLLAVLTQVSAEEIVFRGYIQQQLAARFDSPLIWMVLPAALFAMGHYLPGTAGENALTIAIWSGIFGMLMADLTARSGTLGPAIAVHFVNNVWAILITSLPDDMSGLALFLMPFGMDDPAAIRTWLPVDFAMMLVSWLAARLAIRR
ncbi:MAG: CPBP family intramembrane glutamic endopeptidase [Sulfitobacter sp.]